MTCSAPTFLVMAVCVGLAALAGGGFTYRAHTALYRRLPGYRNFNERQFRGFLAGVGGLAIFGVVLTLTLTTAQDLLCA